jgi:hypothetical protein
MYLVSTPAVKKRFSIGLFSRFGFQWRGWKASNYLMGMSVCFENHPMLGTEPQNILTEGTYLVMLAVGAVRAKTSKRQFKTSAT